MAHILDGKIISARLLQDVGQEVGRLAQANGLIPGLAVVLVGEDPASQVYVASKETKAAAAGMVSRVHRLPETTSQTDLLALVAQLNADAAIHGILVQFPVPAHIDQAAVVAAIDPRKDVDGLHMINAGLLASGQPGLVPCTPRGCMIMLAEACPDPSGLHAVVVGRSNLVGKPIAQLLLQADCTVTMAHSRTRDLPSLCRSADILVAAVGRPEMIRGDWIKPGAIVLDVGINRVPSADPDKAAAGKTRLVGDVAYKECAGIAGAITPVPGGVGLMTVACLLQNTVQAARRIHGV